ncbi:MAG TPA: hypothetical protein PLJ47_07420 [Candidatus Hydrogenedentes bacterium]|nr:hypothetical protein [Candidatus Hydrogenedentota bacterium]HRK34410.1 hypothetical protein [Candidatus Hydrogenedentota bacterium]
MRKLDVFMLAAFLLMLSSGCSTLVDDVARTSPIASRVLKGTSTWYDKQHAAVHDVPPAQTPAPKATRTELTSAATSGQSPSPAETTTPHDTRQSRPANPIPLARVVQNDRTIQALGTSDTSTQLVQPESSLANGLVEAYARYGQFQYREAIDLSVRVYCDDRARPSDKALALIVAAASAYVLGEHGKCLDFLLMAVETDPHIVPNSNVFPSEVRRMHRAARANSK